MRSRIRVLDKNKFKKKKKIIPCEGILKNVLPNPPLSLPDSLLHSLSPFRLSLQPVLWGFISLVGVGTMIAYYIGNGLDFLKKR